MAGVELKHVYKVYEGGVRAVNDFDLEIKDKEFVVFVGPSGCGKSTTLRMIAGLEDITAGKLYIDGELMNDVDSKNRDIAMVFQSYALYPHMTVYDNMAFGLKLRHVDKAIIDQRVRAAAEILEITDLLSRKPKALSGGQRQRVALGRTIVREPKVFLLDEPLSNLDAKLRVAMRSEITKLHENLQTTFIYVTHDQTEAMTMGDRIVVMKDGFLQQADTPISLFEDPTNLFVATFLGSPQMNIIEATLFEEKGILKAKLNNSNDQIVVFPEIKQRELSSKEYIGKKVLLGIRPENILLNKGNLKVHIDVIEHLGDETIVYNKMENRKESLILKMPFQGRMMSNVDTNVEFEMERVYLFDFDTHKSIMGMPDEDFFKCKIDDKSITIGKQKINLPDSLKEKLLSRAYSDDVMVGIQPSYITNEKLQESLPIKVKFEFLEQKTDYQAVYFSIDGLEGNFAFKVKNSEKVTLGKEVTLYLPVERIKIYDSKHNKWNSREIVYEDKFMAHVEQKGENIVISTPFGTFTYPNDTKLASGEYEMSLSQEGLTPIFNKKMVKQGFKNNPEILANKNRIKVSAYDEDGLGEMNSIFVKVKGLPNYATFVVENNFSVYKMPEFEMAVPFEAFKIH